MDHLVAREFLGPLANLPAAPPPPGVTPNLVNPETIKARVIGVTMAFLVLAFFCFVVRIYTRAHILHTFGADDVVLCISMVFSIAMAAIIVVQTNYGLGTHVWDITLITLSPNFLRYTYVSSLLYAGAIIPLKLSVLMLYYRLSPNKYFRWAIYVVFFLIAGTGFANTMAVMFACNPIPKYWDVTIKTGHCVDLAKISIGAGYTNIIYDFFLVVLPLPTIWGLHLPTRQKIAISAILMTGSICVVVGIIRLVEILPLIENTDITWNTANAQMWTMLEIYIGIVCVSVATFHPFLRRYVPWLIGEGSSSSRPSGSYKSGSNSRWNRKATGGDSSGQNSRRSHGMGPWSSRKRPDEESLDLGDGKRSEVRVSAHKPTDRRDGSSEDSTNTPRDSSDHVISSNTDGAGIVKTTHVLVRDEEKKAQS